ncbi:MAG: RNA methyltransferase [Oscillospiraceae bacterium]|jgi:TrmH family RNA methyltransferase|nr:RNA methyltransferase [Oscillospiraceae bacterium]
MEKITSRQNSLLTHIRKLNSSRAYRWECGEYLCDGVKLLEEAVKWNAPLVAVVLTEGVEIPALPTGVRVVAVPEDVMRSVSPMSSPQGVLFTVRLPENPLPERLEGNHYLVLDGLQDPGNVGTILRTADAFECDGVFLVGACADAYNSKTARATMGAIFRREVWSCTLAELEALLRGSNLPLYGTALRDDTVSLSAADFSRCAVAIGSEGKGLSREVLELCEKTVKIPMSERCESLNAAIAAGVVLWEMYR